MKLLFAVTIATLFAVSSAAAGSRVTFDEAKKIQAALNAMNCYGGEMERDVEGAVVFEVDDVVCEDGHFDFKLDKALGVVSKSKS
ncbi:MAG: hypothetical protein ACR2PG_26955 [Hyphomicrobiaceae bacterium]